MLTFLAGNYCSNDLYFIAINKIDTQLQVISFFKKYGYGKHSKVSNNFLLLFANKMLVIRAVIHKMLVNKAKVDHPDYPTNSEVVRSGSAQSKQGRP